jgi:hypothetical protein
MLHLSSVDDVDPCPSDPRSIADWRERVRRRLDGLLGAPPDPVPLEVELTGTVDLGDHRFGERRDPRWAIWVHPLLVESGSGDPLFPVETARTTYGRLRRVYEAVGGTSDAVTHHVFDGDHRWDGGAVEEFLRTALA